MSCLRTLSHHVSGRLCTPCMRGQWLPLTAGCALSQQGAGMSHSGFPWKQDMDLDENSHESSPTFLGQPCHLLSLLLLGLIKPFKLKFLN